MLNKTAQDKISSKNCRVLMWLTVQEVLSQDASIFTKLWSRAQPKRKAYLYRYMTDQSIWQSPRFWSAAFFYAVQNERAHKPTASWFICFFLLLCSSLEWFGVEACPTPQQWLKWSCEAGGGAHLTKPGWSKPHTHSPPN